MGGSGSDEAVARDDPTAAAAAGVVAMQTPDGVVEVAALRGAEAAMPIGECWRWCVAVVWW
jgi:hypothetical protein